MENRENALCYSSTCSETPNQFTHLNNSIAYSSLQQTPEYPFSTIGTMVTDAGTMEYSMTSPLPVVVDTNLCNYSNKDISNVSLQHHLHDESLSGTSVTSSLDIQSPETTPVSDVAMTTVISSEMVAQSHLYANHPSHIPESMPSYEMNNSSNSNNPYEFNSAAHQWENSQSGSAGLQHEHIADTALWPQNNSPTSNVTQIKDPFMSSLESDNAAKVITMPHDEKQSINMQPLSSNNSSYICPQEQTSMQQEPNIDEKNWQHSCKINAYSELKKSSNRRHTISYYADSSSDSSERYEKAEKKLKRRSMNDCSSKKIKLEESHAFDLPNRSSFGHLSREELIQRVVQLEKEKSISKQLDLASSEKNISISTQASLLDGSDEEDTHSCQWSDCNTVTTTLDQLIAHIQDIHIGSGKPAYYCEWAGCTREQKPFLKRHKMQNHMRTHTGERPFVCQIEGCDKRFSRPDSLNTHIKTHSSIRPYACPVTGCSKAYFHSRSLRKHSKSHEASSSTCTSPIDMKEDYYRHYPYERTMKPSRHHQPQIITCGSEARQTQVGFSQYEPIPISNHRSATHFAPNGVTNGDTSYYQDNCTLISDSNSHPQPHEFYLYQEQQQVHAAGPVYAVVPSTTTLHSYNNNNTNRIQVSDQNLYNFGQHYYIY